MGCRCKWDADSSMEGQMWRRKKDGEEEWLTWRWVSGTWNCLTLGKFLACPEPPTEPLCLPEPWHLQVLE